MATNIAAETVYMFNDDLSLGLLFYLLSLSSTHRVHIGVEEKQEGCICPLSWSVPPPPPPPQNKVRG